MCVSERCFWCLIDLIVSVFCCCCKFLIIIMILIVKIALCISPSLPATWCACYTDAHTNRNTHRCCVTCAIAAFTINIPNVHCVFLYWKCASVYTQRDEQYDANMPSNSITMIFALKWVNRSRPVIIVNTNFCVFSSNRSCFKRKLYKKLIFLDFYTEKNVYTVRHTQKQGLITDTGNSFKGWSVSSEHFLSKNEKKWKMWHEIAPKKTFVSDQR